MTTINSATSSIHSLSPEALTDPSAVEGAGEVLLPESSPLAATATEDARLLREANAILGALAADPLMAVELAQSWLRDLGIEVREDGAESAQDRAEMNELLAALAHEAERAARASAADSNVLGQIFGWIGTALAVAVSAATSWCTGGASAALGVAAVACMVAAQTVTELGRAGIIDDPDLANGLAMGLSILGTVLSLGANSAGSGAQAATTTATTAAEAGARAALEATRQALEATRQALEAIKQGLQAAQTVIGVASGVNQIVGAVYTHDADLAEIDGERNELHADDARTEVTENVGDLGTLMRQFRRMAERMAEVRAAAEAGHSAAIIRV